MDDYRFYNMLYVGDQFTPASTNSIYTVKERESAFTYKCIVTYPGVEFARLEITRWDLKQPPKIKMLKSNAPIEDRNIVYG